MDAGGRTDRLLAAALAALEPVLAADADAPAVRPGRSAAPADLRIRRTGASPRTAVTQAVAALEAGGVNTRSAGYLGYLPNAATADAAVADLLAAALNPYSAMASLAPGAAAMEDAVVRWLCEAVGLPAGSGGVLTSGGSLATLTAVVAAREAHAVRPADAARHVVYLGEHRHHSVDRALRFAGLAEAAVRVVPSAAGHRMDAGALAGLVAADARAGLRPWLVVATAGTTGSGAVDPVADVAAVARRHGAHLHVDAAYGGLFALAPGAPAALAGLGDADTVTVDPHKALATPYGTGALLAADPRLLLDAFGHTADYLEHETPDDGPHSPADLGLELTRPFRALRLWLPLRLDGSDAVRATLQQRLELARHAHAALCAAPGVRTGPPPDLAVVTFRAAGPDADHRTRALAADLRRDGRWFLTPTVLDGRPVLRLAVGTAATTRADVDDVVHAVRTLLRPGLAA